MIMKKPKLYIKNDKGRYEEYQEPKSSYDNVLYKKVQRGKKVVYEPTSMLVTNDLPEGVWVIVKHRGSKSFTSGEYLMDCYMCLKASDIQDVSLAKLGGMERLAEHLSQNWNKLPKDKSIHELCRAIVGTLFLYENSEDKK